MNITVDSVVKKLNRPKLIAGLTMAGLLAGANLAVQAADFNPVADSYTDETAGSENNGTGTRLRVRSSASGEGQIAFLKFDVSGVTGSVSSATLQLYANSASGEPVTAYAVSDNSWTESGITWNNQPALGSALDTVNVADGVYNNFDVSGLVTGDGTYTIAIQGDTDVKQSFRSREHGSLPILTTGSLSEFSIVSSPYPTDDIVVISESAADHGIASDGSVDVTSDIQDLLDLVQAKGGGTAFLPEGTYRIDGNLIIPSGVWLRGVWEEPTPGQPINGTVLAIYGGRNSTNSTPVIHHSESSGTKDLVFWYPEQDPNNIVPYPPTIGGYRAIEGDYKGLQRAVGMKNLTFVNSYIAISAIAEDPTRSVGAHFNINNVYGTALYRGIQSGYISGNSKWTGLFFSPDYWSGSGFAGSPTDSSHENWAKSNGAGIRISTKGQIYIQHARFSGFKRGVLQEDEGSDSSFYDCHFTNCTFGFTGLAYSTRAVNCVFEGSVYGLEWDYVGPNKGEGLYHSCTFSGGTAAVNIPICESQNFQACRFSNKVILEEGVVTAVDCDFNFSGTHVELDHPADGIALIGNRYGGNFKLEDNSRNACVKIDHTPLTFEPLPSFTYADYRTTVQDFKPAVAKLFDAMDYGAHGDGVNDDTAAIQATIDAAAAAGGAIAFLPPGVYNVPGTLNVPSHVELRGSADGHHSANGEEYATVLLVSNDQGNANGTPFITLQANSGLRGMSFFYPDQDIPASEYPYLIRGVGENIYLWNLHAANVARMCDFATHRCDNFYANALYLGALHNAYDIGNGTTGGRIYMGMHKPFWNQMPASIEPTPPTEANNVYTTEFLRQITLGDCSNLVVMGTFLRSNYIGVQANEEGGSGPNNMLMLNSGGEGNRVAYEINKLSGPLYVVSSGIKCGASPASNPFTSQFLVNYPDPYKVVAIGNAMDSGAEMEVVVSDGDLEIQGVRLDQQVSQSGFWVEPPGRLKVSAAYSPEIAAFGGDGTIEAYGCNFAEGAADSNSERLTSYWNKNIVQKFARCVLASTYEYPIYYGLEILETDDSDYTTAIHANGDNSYFTGTQPVPVDGQDKKKLYLDVVNPDLVNQSMQGKLFMSFYSDTNTNGVSGDTMVHVYYDQNGKTLASSFDAADPEMANGKWNSWGTIITNCSFNNGINGGDVLIEIGADAVVSFMNVEIKDKNNVCELPDTTPPAAPSGLEAVAGDQSVSLDWADNTEEDLAGYSVYRSTNSGNYGAALVTNWVASGYVDHAVSNGTTYYYVVTASDTNSNGSSASGEVAATPVPAQPGAGIIVELEGIRLSTNQGTVFSNLNGSVTNGNGSMVPSGSFSVSDMGSAETFAVTVPGVRNWDYAAVSSAGSTSGLGAPLAYANINGNNKGWGVDGAGSSDADLDLGSEALVVRFNLVGLTAAHQSGFRLKGFSMGKWDNGEAYNYMILDASGNVITSSAGQTNVNLSLDIALNDGDSLVIGHETGAFRLGEFKVDVAPPLDSYDIWALNYGGAAIIGSSTNDYDGDGRVNLAEYAFGGNPTNRLDYGEDPTMHSASGGMRYIHPQRSDDPELISTVEVSTNLISGGWTHDGVTVIGTNVTGEVLNVVTNQVPDAEPKLYIRLKVGNE